MQNVIDNYSYYDDMKWYIHNYMPENSTKTDIMKAPQVLADASMEMPKLHNIKLIA